MRVVLMLLHVFLPNGLSRLMRVFSFLVAWWVSTHFLVIKTVIISPVYTYYIIKFTANIRLIPNPNLAHSSAPY
jgi:hypothetical protein